MLVKSFFSEEFKILKKVQINLKLKFSWCEKSTMRCIRSLVVLILCVSLGNGDDVELEVQSSLMLKMLREMSNQTNSSSLNLPANASSIRENITDTFSCENRTYGYYADVDNDCQLFHVCLPSQAPGGRNVTYKWSFICPNETIFNQVVLVCTRPIDSIDCADSPMYYDVNKEIGKIPNNTKSEQPTQKPARRRPDNRKQNLMYEEIEAIVDQEMSEKIQEIDEGSDNIENVFPIIEMPTGFEPNEFEPQGIVNKDKIIIDDERLVMERSAGKKASFRFKADV